VIAMDVGGSGDSGWRASYSREQIVQEILSVCTSAGLFEAARPPVLVGHSLGGQYCVEAAIAWGEKLLGVIGVDCLRQELLDKDPARRLFNADAPKRIRTRKTFPHEADLISRFRLYPDPGPIHQPHVIAHIATHSGRKEADGWTWKADPNLVLTSGHGLHLKDRLRELACRSAAVYGEHSFMVSDNTLSLLRESSDGRTSGVIIPGSTHYPMLDNPVAFLTAVRAIIAGWESDSALTART